MIGISNTMKYDKKINEESSRLNHHSRTAKVENIFLLFSIFFGLLFSFIQPMFFEPDSSFHFDSAMYTSNTVVDRTDIGFSGEDYQSMPIPFTKIVDMHENGTYFKNFFGTKLPLIHKKDADSRISNSYGTEHDLRWSNDIMHVVPALGVKLGYSISPTIGVMVITARLLNVLFFSFTMFFIIKFLKAYKYIFMAVSLTPTVIQTAASLSYDCYNYISCAVAIMIIINFGVEIKSGKKINLTKFLINFLIASVFLFFSKTNSKLLFLGLVAIGTHLLLKKLKIILKSKHLLIAVVLILGGGILALSLFYSEQIIFVVKRIIYTLLEPYYTVLTTEVISGTTTAAIPYWLYGIQVAVLTLLFLSYHEEVVPKWMTLGALLLVVLNFFAIMISYGLDLDFLDSSERIITGPQGRYFTPFLLLLAPAGTLVAQKITVLKGKWLLRLVVAMSILVLIVNLGITSIKFYHLNLPMDEYRSGVEHYIFK